MRPQWRHIGLGLSVFVLLAAGGIGVFVYMLSSWSQVQTVQPDEADRAFTKALVEGDGKPPYLEIRSGNTVLVRRELENTTPIPLKTLQLLAWDPETKALIRIDFPFWFVRLKMTDSLNLGTLTALLAEDWENLDLSVSVDDLERRGPGLILDHQIENGARILLKTVGDGEH